MVVEILFAEEEDLESEELDDELPVFVAFSCEGYLGFLIEKLLFLFEIKVLDL